MAARARCGNRLVQHRRDGKIPHCSSSRRRRGFNPTWDLQRSGCRPSKKTRRDQKPYPWFWCCFRSEVPRANFAATDTAMSDRRAPEPPFRFDQNALRPWAAFCWPDDCRCGPSRNFDGAVCLGRPMWADQLQARRIVATFSDVLQRCLAARSRLEGLSDRRGRISGRAPEEMGLPATCRAHPVTCIARFSRASRAQNHPRLSPFDPEVTDRWPCGGDGTRRRGTRARP